jgi:hypothetical protein
MPTSSSLFRISVLASSTLFTAPFAHAAPPTREACLEAHGSGQDAREAGRLVQAGKLFLTCAQPTCPALVQSDCARFVDELARLQSTVTFAARDGEQNDLQDTSVFVDGTLVASRLGEGKAYDVDPGPHEVRFVHAGKEMVVKVVVNQGEKGRGIVGAFPSPPAAPRGPAPAPALPAATPPAPAFDTSERTRPGGPLVLVSLGAAAAVAGGVLIGVGLDKIPARCSLSTNECAAPPNDPVFDQASSGTKMVNLGAIIGGGGALMFAGSLIWYYAQPRSPARRTATALLPWVGSRGAGLSFAGAL